MIGNKESLEVNIIGSESDSSSTKTNSHRFSKLVSPLETSSKVSSSSVVCIQNCKDSEGSGVSKAPVSSNSTPVIANHDMKGISVGCVQNILLNNVQIVNNTLPNGLGSPSCTSPSMRTCHHASFLPAAIDTKPSRGVSFFILFSAAKNLEKEQSYAFYKKCWLAARQGNRASGITRANQSFRQAKASRQRVAVQQKTLERLAHSSQRRMSLVLLHKQSERIKLMHQATLIEARSSACALNRHLLRHQKVQKLMLHSSRVRRTCLMHKMRSLLKGNASVAKRANDLCVETISTLLGNRKKLLEMFEQNADILSRSLSSITLVEDADITELTPQREVPSPVSSAALTQDDWLTPSSRRSSVTVTSCQETPAHHKLRALIENGSAGCKLPMDLYKECGSDSGVEELRDLLPPINRFTLRELEIDEFLSNAQLRHDLYFNADIHFKPNVSGEKGVQKLAKANAYWSELEIELSSGRLARLPLILYEIKSIVCELIPLTDETRTDVEEHFDLEFICGQLERGSFMQQPLVNWLGTLLKQTCAPARDAMVDDVVRMCNEGSITVTRTLRMLFNVLEVMKLDCANHLLEKLRPFIVSTAFTREWQWFMLRIQKRVAKLSNTLEFFAPFSIQGYHEKVLKLISSASMFSAGKVSIPETFQMDVSRIIEIYNDIQDIGVMASLIMLFKQACKNRQTKADMESIKKNLWVLLNDPDITIWNVVLEIARVGGKIRGSPFSEKETQMLNGLVESTLNPNSKLFEIVKNKIRVQVLSALSTCSPSFIVEKPKHIHTVTFNDEELSKMGLLEMKTEVVDLAKKVVNLVQYNKGVYGRLYHSLEHYYSANDAESLSEAKLDEILTKLG